MTSVPPEGSPGRGPDAGAGGVSLPPGRRRRPAVGVAAGLAALLVAGVVAGATQLRDDDGGRSTTASTTEPGGDGADPTTTQPEPDGEGAGPPPQGGPPEDPGPEATASELEATVAELSEHVAEVRGAPFPEPVTVELLEDDAFEERLLEDVEEEREDIDLVGRLLVALHLLDPSDDLYEIYRDFLGVGVIGFYDPETGELVVRGAALTTATRSTIVHELTHAYDDQRFELHRPDVQDADDETALGFSALVEGNAVRVQQRWEATLGRDELDELLAEQLADLRDVDLGAIPPVLLQQLTYPYTEGPLLVDALVDAGGERRVDAAFAEPPTTSEQVSEPAAYLRGEGALPVPLPPADGDVVDQGTFGQLTLRITLAEALDRRTAGDAAEGWGGDAYVAWYDGDRTCVRIAFRMDTPRDLDELAEAWDEWADRHPDATVADADGTVTVTACG